MGWEDYQRQNFSNQSMAGKKKARAAILTVVLLGLVLVMAADLDELSVQVRDSLASEKYLSQDHEVARKEKDKSFLEKPFDQFMKLEDLSSAPKVVKVRHHQDDYLFRLSFDTDLQNFIQKKLERYRVDWAGVSVIEPSTGSILALASYSKVEPERDKLYAKSIFPAASVFKIVTAAAAIEEGGLTEHSRIVYAGYPQKLHKKYLGLRGGTELSLAKAFALSANGIFGAIGSKYLTESDLQKYADGMGFNEKIPFDFDIDQSQMRVGQKQGDVFERAKLAAGFGKVTLSPLHGAMIAGAVINQGQMMQPYLVENVYKKNGQLAYQHQIQSWKQSMDASSAKSLQKMMRRTVESGTAKRSFRSLLEKKYFQNFELGGKTGSLTSKDPHGRNEWFVGYAGDQNNQIAFGMVITSEKYWKVKPAELARQVVQYYFTRGEQDSSSEEEVAFIGPMKESSYGEKQKS
ncbi:MAG: hypothetical protein KDD52_03840 [Bdellovibrionales bacterium]|nr:hypothetical protein [Bdellovibrionales bacterium]